MSDKSLASELDAYVKAVSTAGGWPAWDALVTRVRDLEALYQHASEGHVHTLAALDEVIRERDALKAENEHIEANLKALCDAAVHWERKARETAERERDALQAELEAEEFDHTATRRELDEVAGYAEEQRTRARKAALQEALRAVDAVSDRDTGFGATRAIRALLDACEEPK